MKKLVLFASLVFASMAMAADLENLSEVLQNSNWEKNTQMEAKQKWEKKIGEVWTSADGKVTFAVGATKSRLANLARSMAEMDARVLLLTRGRPVDGAISGELVYSVPLMWKSDKKKGCIVLMAIPTELLPELPKEE
jgi:hypothetical protein